MVAEDRGLIIVEQIEHRGLIVEIEPDFIEAEIGEEIQFRCVIREDYDFEIKIDMIWNKNNNTVFNSNFDDDYDNELSLTVHSVRDAGTYSCQAIDFENNVKSNIATAELKVLKHLNDEIVKLDVNITSNKPIDYQTKVLTTKESENVTLNCLVVTNSYPITLDWYLVDGELDLKHHFKSNNGRHLEIQNIQKNHAGKYECVVQKAHSSLELFSDMIEIKVEDKELDEIEEEEFGTRSEPIRIDLEKRIDREFIILDCTIRQGFPVPTLTWRRNGQSSFDNLEERILVNQYSEIYLDKYNPDHYGFYECIASNIFENLTKNIELGI